MSSNEILINQLFAGRYLSEEGNIGHEIINLFDDDAGDRYLFITPYGAVKNHEVDTIVFVRNIKARKTVEVIAVATGLTEIDIENSGNLVYGGVPLHQIFRNNKYRGEKDIVSLYASYKADEIYVPVGDRRLLISIDDEFDLARFPGSIRLTSRKKVLVPQGMRSYLSKEQDELAYGELTAFLKDKELWERVDDSKLIADNAAENAEPTFLEIIGKEDDEIAFSNLLSHYFQYSYKAFGEFAKKVLGVPDMDTEFAIVRESVSNIDLWIESDNYIIVVENKLKSGINGLDDEGGSQLDKYYDVAVKHARDTGKTAKFYVFAPNYSNIDFEKYDAEHNWKVVMYSSIYKFFLDNAPTYMSERYFVEFLRALERHTLSMSELNFKTMRSRFMRKIAQSR